MTVLRTCLGCRRQDAKTALIRLVLTEGRVRIDSRQRWPGRGAYLHPDSRCWRRALRQRAVARALRTGSVDPVALEAELDGHLRSAGDPGSVRKTGGGA